MSKKVYAIMMVAIMLIVPVTAIDYSVFDAELNPVPSPSGSDELPSYAYKLKISGNTSGNAATVSGVYEYDFGAESWNSTAMTAISDWQFDASTGYGPFNSFYCTFTTSGQMYQLLDPNDLTKYIATYQDGEWNYSDKGSSSISSRNTMWVIPTVYISSEANGALILSNKSQFGGEAYAHTIGGHEYQYLAIGVYEGSVSGSGSSSTLMSVSNATPAGTLNRYTFHNYADNTFSSSDGVSSMWNYYQWTLYKMCSYMAISSFDSMGTIGYGNVGAPAASQGVTNNTGLTNGRGAYYGTTDDYTSSMKLFIENSWGNIWEYVDDLYTSGNKIYVGQNDLGQLKNDAAYKTTGEKKTISLIAGQYSGNDIQTILTQDGAWGTPASVGSAMQGATGIHEGFFSDSSAENLLTVGGGSTSGARAGLTFWYSNGKLDFTRQDFGARLTYVFDVPAKTVSGDAYVYELITKTDSTQTTVTNVIKNGVAVGKMSDKEDMNAVWGFDEYGFGPFNSFYAEMNDNGTMLAMLDPDNLGMRINGDPVEAGHNIMWILPTVYWKTSSYVYKDSSNKDVTVTTLTLTNVKSDDVTAYAHTIGGHVYQYLALGVYEASTVVDDGVTKLMSLSGKTPVVGDGKDTSKGMFTFHNWADNTYSSSSSGVSSMWNYYQYTLYKMCSFTVMGSLDSEGVVGKGYTGSGLTAGNTTGGTDTGSPYSGSTADRNHSSKLFLENTWGSIWECIDDTIVTGGVLKAGQNDLGQLSNGSVYKTKSTTSIFTVPKSTNNQNIDTMNLGDVSWGTPAKLGTSSYTRGLYDGYYMSEAAGDYMAASGGRYDNTDGKAGLSIMSISTLMSNSYGATVGARLAYVFDTGNVSTMGGVDVYEYTVKVEVVNGASKITSVTKNGAAITGISSRDAVDSNWGFDKTTGIGPFNSFYCTFDSSGRMHYLLDPYDLTKYLATWDSSAKSWVYGSEKKPISDYTENTMWVIPTIYISTGADGVLTLTNSSSGGGIPYAHTIDGHVYDCLALGVYPGSVSGSGSSAVMKSTANSTIKTDQTRYAFEEQAERNVVQNGEAFTWNYYQWTLYKMCSYTVLGTLDTKSLEPGNAGYGGTTGSMKSYGPYSVNGNNMKLFLENTAGSTWEFVGDCYRITKSGTSYFYAGQNSSWNSSNYQTKASTLVYTQNSTNNGTNFISQILTTSNENTIAWGMPSVVTGSGSNTGAYQYGIEYDPACACVGGQSGKSNIADIGIDGAHNRSQYILTSRLAFVFDDSSYAEACQPVITKTSHTDWDWSVIKGELTTSAKKSELSLPKITDRSSPWYLYSTGIHSIVDISEGANKVTSIADGAFEGMTGLKKVSLPNAECAIPDHAFEDNTELTTVDIPKATSIGSYAFKGCTALSVANFPVALSIGSNAFEGCTSMVRFSLDSMTAAGDNAFTGCSKITTITLPKATSIGDSAFSDCTKLKSITLDSLTEITEHMMDGANISMISDEKVNAVYYYRLSVESTKLKVEEIDSEGNLVSVPESVSKTGGVFDQGDWTWDDSTGYGPFGSFYCTFDASGNMHQLLKPSNLAQYIASWEDGAWNYSKTGSSSITTENTMWVIPTVYWKTVNGKLIITNDPDNGGTAYAHTVGNETYEYMALGVYEAYVDASDDSKLKSLSGKTPTDSLKRDDLRADAKKNTVNDGYASIWTFYQWELYKYCGYAVTGDFNVQNVIGAGNVGGGVSWSDHEATKAGLLDGQGAYASKVGNNSKNSGAENKSSAKLFLENTWGSQWEVVDGTYYADNSLYVTQSKTPINQTNGSRNTSCPSEKLSVSTAGNSKSGYMYVDDARYWGYPTNVSSSSTVAVDSTQYVYNGNTGFKVGQAYDSPTGNIGSIYGGNGVTESYPCDGSRLFFVFGTNSQSKVSAGALSVPSVTKIDDGAFEDSTTLTTIDSSAVKEIGEYAFAGCTNLTTVNLPSVTVIPEGAFMNDTALTTVNMPAVTIVEKNAFSGCERLSSVVLSSTSCNVGEGSFKGTGTKGNGLRLAARISMMGSGVFSGSAIKAIAEESSLLVDGTISMNSLKSVPARTFEGVKNINTFTSTSVTNIEDSAFYNMPDLITVSIPSVQSVGKNSFSTDPKLNMVTLGTNKVSISEAAFKASGSVGFTVKGNIVNVGKEAFSGSKIQYIKNNDSDPAGYDVVLSSATGVQNNAFYNTPVQTVIMSALTNIGSDAFNGCSSLTKVTINDAFKGTLSANVFRDCSSLTEIRAIGVSNIEKHAFHGCSSLVTGEFGVMEGDEYKSSCTAVGEYAFCKCSQYDASKLVSKLKTISNYAFSESATVTLTSTVADATIGNYAFSKCPALQTVDSAAKTIGVNAFDMTGSNTALLSVKMDHLITMGVESFKNCTSLTTVSMGTIGTSTNGGDPVYLTEVPSNAFSGCGMLDTVNIPHVETIGNNAFYQCPIYTFGSVEDLDTIESGIISLPNVKTIGENAFLGNWNMENVVAGSITSISANAFSNCSNLYTFRADSIGSIADKAFFECSNLYHISDTKSASSSERSAYLTKVSSIGSEVFTGSSIEHLYTGDLDTLSASAFSGMTNLTEAVIQGAVNSLPDNTFDGCTVLANVYLPASVTYIGKEAFEGTPNPTVLSNCSVKPTGSVSDITFKGTFTDSSIHWGYVADMVGVSAKSFRIIDGAKYVLPYGDNDEVADVVQYLKTGKAEAELNAGKSGSVVDIYLYKSNETLTFRSDRPEIGGFTVKATFSDLSAFEGGVEPTLNVTQYAEVFTLPVPKTEGELKDENFTKYVGFDSSITFGDDVTVITQPFTVHMTFYESKFELFSNKSTYDLIQHYNVPPITSEMTGMPDTKTTTYTAGVQTEYLDPAPEVAGYNYKGWFYDQAGTPGKEVEGNVVIMNKTQHIYAIYEPKVVNVTFKLGDKVLATSEAEQYVTLQVYNRGDELGGRIVVSGVNGPDNPVYVYYSEEDYQKYFTPTVIGDGQDLKWYVINSKAYADSDEPGYTMIEKLYDDTVVEVQSQNRLYDIKVESYGIQCEAPALADVKVSGISMESGYWMKGLVYIQLDGISFPIQEVTAKGAAFHHAELYRGETKLGSYGNIQGYIQTDIPINHSTFGAYKSLTIKLYFEKSKYTLRYNMPDNFQGTYTADNSRSIGVAEDITLLLPTPMGQSIAGYTFEGWYFNDNKLEKTKDDVPGYLGTTGYLTEEMKAEGDKPENSMIIDVYAKFTEKSYLVRYSYQAENSDGKTQTYTRYAQTLDGEGQPQYTLVKIGQNIPYIVMDGETPSSMIDLVRENKTLTGWYYSGTQPYITKLLTAKATSELIVSATSEFQGYNVIVLTAVWEDKTYTIKFDPGYYDQGMISQTQSAKVGEKFVVPSSLTLKKEYHVFGYWYLGTTDTKFADNEEVKLIKEYTVYADASDIITVEVFWKYDTYNIVYDSSIYQDAKGELPDRTDSIQIGTKFEVAGVEHLDEETGEMVPWLTRTGYTLIGWNYSKNPTVDPPKSPLSTYETMTEAMAATASTTDHNVHLYPVWSPMKYTIEYDLDGGKYGAYAPNYASFGSDVTISAPTKYGFTFAGWTADPASISIETACYSQGGNYISWDGYQTKATVFKNLTTDSTKPVKLTAHWERAEYTVKYDQNGATGPYAGGDQLTCVVGGTLKLAEVGDMTYTGRSFGGWTVNGVLSVGGSGETITVDDNMAGHADSTNEITFYALWEFNSYTIEYRATDSAKYTPVNTFYDVAVNIGIPERDGYTFTGWKASSLGTTAMYSRDGSSWMPWPSTDITPIGSYVINLTDGTDTVRLDAQWEKTKYTITYNANGSDGTPPADTYPCTIGDPFLLEGQGTLSKPGYLFAGWSIDKINLITSTIFTASMAEKADSYNILTVYVMWTPGSYTVQSQVTDESEYRETTAYFDVPVDIGIPEREGYNFTGWASSDITPGTAMYSRNGESWFSWMNTSDVVYAAYFKNLTSNIGGAVHLTAQWSSIEYTVKYDANGGKGTVPVDSEKYHVDDPFTLVPITGLDLTNGNKKLIGWSLDRDDVYAMDTDHFDSSYVLYADSNNVVTFYAVWAEGSYTVTVDIGKATADGVPYGWTDQGNGKYTRTAEYGDSVKEIMEEWDGINLTLEGYKFVSWSMERTKVVSNLTVTAVFEEVSSTMLYIMVGVIAAIIVLVFVSTRIERR